MMHDKRIWCLSPSTPAEISTDLAGKDNPEARTWTLCTGYRYELGGKTYLFVNDSTSEDALQEYALLEVISDVYEPYTDYATVRQLESITVSWCTREDLLGYLTKVNDPEFLAFVHTWWGTKHFTIQTHPQNERCWRCA